MKTCATSPASDCSPTLDACRPSSSGARPVRTSAAPTTAGPVVSMASGRACISTSSVSSGRSALIGMRLRTLLQSKLGDTTGSTLRWTPSTTPAGHPWWVLARLDTSTFEREAGLLALMCPTPRANRWGMPDSHGRAHPAMLPTPVVTSNFNKKTERANSRSGDGLGTAVLNALMPTPTKGEANRGGSYGQGNPTLAKSVKDAVSRSASPRSSEPPRRLGSGGVRALLSITEWLMGFDPGWLASAFPPTATPSSRTSRKPSPE